MYKPKENKLKGYAYYKKLETSEGITNDKMSCLWRILF